MPQPVHIPVAFILRHYRPDRSSHLIGERDRNAHTRLALQHPRKPRVLWRGFAAGLLEHRHRTDDQKAPQIALPHFRRSAICTRRERTSSILIECRIAIAVGQAGFSAEADCCALALSGTSPAPIPQRRRAGLTAPAHSAGGSRSGTISAQIVVVHVILRILTH